MDSTPAPGGFGGSGDGAPWGSNSGEGSATMFGLGVPIPWWVILTVIVALVGFQLYRRAQRG